MYLHRIIPVDPFIADPFWSETQVVPPALAAPERMIEGGGAGGTIYWWAVPYNGADVNASTPCDGTGITLDARLVYTSVPALLAGGENIGRANRVVVGRKSVGEVELAPIPISREVIELAPPRGTAGVLQMLSVAGVAPPCTHIWLFWSFETKGGI